MAEAMLAQFAREGFAAAMVTLSSSADVRFRGQASEVRIPIDPPFQSEKKATDGSVADTQMVQQLCATFVAEHERLYGHGSDPNNPVEVVAVRLVGRAGGASAGEAQSRPFKLVDAAAEQPRQSSRLAYFGAQNGLVQTPIISRRELGDTLAGPFLIDEYDATTVVPPGVLAQRDKQGNVILRIG
jgi:N-methylhydantoinase A